MATELGSAFISVGLGTNKLAGDIKKAFGGAGADGNAAGQEAGKGFKGGFGLIAGAVAALGIGAALKASVAEAGDLEQSVGAIGSVFKDSAGQMNAWADSAAVDVGLSKNEFNELGTLIGAQLKNGGTAMDQLGPKTKDLIGVGADLASMFGGTTTDAVSALSSALKGERDPIERYGVSLNQTKIDAEAAALGFAKVGGSLSAEANQAATLSLIMKQTADAHGNFGRETDTLAHKQQVLSAQLANGKARIGAELLPAVAALTGAMSSALGPALNVVVGGLHRVVGAGQGLYDLFAKGDFTGAMAGAFNVDEDSGFVNFLFNVRDVATEVTGGFRAMFAAFKAGDGDVTSSGFAGFMERVGNGAREVTGGISAMFAAFKAGDGDVTSSGFAGVMEKIGNAARGVFDSIGPALSGLAPSFLALVPLVMQLFQALSPTSLIFQALLPVLPQIAAAVGSVIGMILPLAASLASQLLPIITQLISTILPPLVDIFGNIVTSIAPLIMMIAGLLIPIIMALMPVVVTVFGVIASVITSVMQIIQGVIQVVTGIISGDWGKVWQGIQNIFGGIWNTIVAIVTGVFATIWSVISSGLNAVLSFIGNVLGNIGKFFSDTWNNVTRGISDFIGGIGKFFEGIPGAIMGALSGAGTWLFDAGKNIVQGLFDGIKSLAGTIGNFFLGLLPGWIVEPFKLALGIHSPSRVFAGFGVNIGQGLIGGIDGMNGKIENAVTGMVSLPPVPSFSAGSYSPQLASAGVGGGGFPSSLRLVVDGHEFTAYVDGRVGSGMNNVATMAGGRR